MPQNTSSHFKNLPGAIALSFLCMLCVLLAGFLTSGIVRAFFPLGYFLRFLVYAGLTFLIVRKLCSMSGLTLPECRITSFRLSFLSVFWAVLLPVFLFAAACMGSRGKLADVQPPDKRASGELVLLPLLYRNLQRSRGGGGIPRLYAESV